jgi:16S rRNA processing protein RimM
VVHSSLRAYHIWCRSIVNKTLSPRPEARLTTLNQWLELGRIGGPYGVRGWVHVESFTEPKNRLLQFPQWNLSLSDNAASQPWQVAETKTHGEKLVVRFADVADRDAAARLRGSRVLIERSLLAPLEARQFYEADLLGLTVLDLQQQVLGTVRQFIATPAASYMVVKTAANRELWIPATPQYLNKVDLQDGQVWVAWPQNVSGTAI